MGGLSPFKPDKPEQEPRFEVFILFCYMGDEDMTAIAEMKP